MKVALLAALSLGIANVFSVLMVQAEARGRPVVAGLTEVGYWVANIFCIKTAVNHFTWQLVIFCVISAYISTYFATRHGHEGIEDVTDVRQDNEINKLEERVEVLEAEGEW
jgi:uncharacterized protein YlxW (UPF0749 family)